MEIRKIDTNIDARIETGPLQINDDWLGFFFRGDDCFGNVQNIKYIIENGSEDHMRDLLTHFAEQFEKAILPDTAENKN